MVRTAGRATPCTAALRSGGRAGAPLPRAARSGAGAAPAQPRRETPPPGSLTCRPRGGGGPGRCEKAAASPRSALSAEPRPLRPLTPPFPAPPAAAPTVPRRPRPRPGHTHVCPLAATPHRPHPLPRPSATPTATPPGPGRVLRTARPRTPRGGGAGPGAAGARGGASAGARGPTRSEHRARAGDSRQKRCPARPFRGQAPRAQRGWQGADRGCSVS